MTTTKTNSILSLKNWTIKQKLELYFLNPWNLLWVSHGHFIDGETEAGEINLLCPSSVIEPRLAPRRADPRACAYSTTPLIFTLKGQHCHWESLQSYGSVSSGIWQEAGDLNRSFKKECFWLASVLFKAINLGLTVLHINLVPGKMVTRH